MELLAISKFLLTVTFATAFNVQGLRKDTLQQQLFIPGVQENEAGHYSRITHGLVAAANQFPYQVGLEIFHADDGREMCSGSIISNRWVLTAAHCIIDCISASLYVGGITFHGSQEVFRNIPRNWMKPHYDYNRTTVQHDIGLVQIPPVRFRKGIDAVDLPPRNFPLCDGAYAYLAGWGTTSDSSNMPSPNLLYQSFKIISNENCARVFGVDKIYWGKLCTETSNQISACKGDSGGALVLEGTKIQIGIQSFTSRYGCESRRPNAYTRVEKYLQWIHDHTGLPV